MKAVDPSNMAQGNPDKLMEWLRLVLTNTKFSRILPVITSCLSLEQIGELMSAKAVEIKELEKLTHEISNGNIDGAKMDYTNEISREEEEEDTQSVILSDEDMVEETIDSGDNLNHTKTPEDVVVMNAMPTREAARLKRLEEADEDWHPPAKKDIKGLKNVRKRDMVHHMEEEHDQKPKENFLNAPSARSGFRDIAAVGF